MTPTIFKTNKPRASESAEAITPILEWMHRNGFIVVTPKLGFLGALRILVNDKTVKGVVWRVNTGVLRSSYKGRESFTRFGIAGQADISGVLRGGVRIELECKRPGKKPTSDQNAFGEVIRQLGGIAFYATSPDEVAAKLQLFA